MDVCVKWLLSQWAVSPLAGGEATGACQAGVPQHPQEAYCLSAGPAGRGCGEEVCQIALGEYLCLPSVTVCFPASVHLSVWLGSTELEPNAGQVTQTASVQSGKTAQISLLPAERAGLCPYVLLSV